MPLSTNRLVVASLLLGLILPSPALRAGPGAGSPSVPATTRTTATLAERLFGEISSGGRAALDAYYSDRLDETLERANEALAQDPVDPAALLAQALVSRDRGDLDRASLGVTFLAGRYPSADILELQLGDVPDPALNKRLCARAEKDPRPDPICLAQLAKHKRVLLQGRSAREALKRARAAVGRPDRETLLAIADAALDLDDVSTARQVLDEYRTLFGEDTWWMVQQSYLRLAAGEMVEAAKIGVAAFQQDPRRIWVLKQISGLLFAAGLDEKFAELLRQAHQSSPSLTGLEGPFLLTVLRLIRKLNLKQYVDGIFHVSVLEGLPSEPVANALSAFKEAYRKVGALFGYFPQRVKLVIFDTIIDRPEVLAYFSPMDDTIYVGAVHYQAGNDLEELTAKTVSEHEYTHYVHSELQRNKGLKLRYQHQVKWLAEGIAEWASNGLKLRRYLQPSCLSSYFTGGMVPLHDLANPDLNLFGQVKGWYFQGNFMVRYLMGLGADRARQLDRLVELSVDFARGEDLEVALKNRFGISLEQFEKGYASLIKGEMARAERN